MSGEDREITKKLSNFDEIIQLIKEDLDLAK